MRIFAGRKTKISLAGYYNRTLDAYMLNTGYERFTFNYTDISSLNSCSIPVDNRQFSVDRETGIVTVSDKTGALPDETLSYRERKRFNSTTFADNSNSPVTRYGLEWIIDFKRINPINTTIRLDGSFYGYYTLDKNLLAECPHSVTGADGEYFKYIGYYVGGDGLSNGRESQNVNTNITITTHIPKIRMIISLRAEATLHRYTRYLSEKDGGNRSYALSDGNDILSVMDGSAYDYEAPIVVYPEYYTTYDDPYTHRNFYEDLMWARENDPQMYSDLSRLANNSINTYWYKKDYVSPYFSMNFSITKEIGDIASISFYANNFFNNFGQVYSTRSGTRGSISSYIPKFYYGLTLRLKF